MSHNTQDNEEVVILAKCQFVNVELNRKHEILIIEKVKKPEGSLHECLTRLGGFQLSKCPGVVPDLLAGLAYSAGAGPVQSS